MPTNLFKQNLGHYKPKPGEDPACYTIIQISYMIHTFLKRKKALVLQLFKVRRGYAGYFFKLGR